MSIKSRSSKTGLLHPSRRAVLGALSSSVAAVAFTHGAFAQDDVTRVSPAQQGAVETQSPAIAAPLPFSFDWLDARMKEAAQAEYVAPSDAPEVIADLDYDDYRKIQFDPKRARWADNGVLFHLHAFHPGWLYKQTVAVHEVVDGIQTPMEFSTDDFLYYDDLAPRVPQHVPLPGVAGFRLNTPLNRADMFDELVAFAGASYFRALARNSSYGLLSDRFLLVA